MARLRDDRLIELEPGAEVGQHRAPVCIAHHVVRLDITVYQTGPMHGCQRISQIDPDANRSIDVEGSTLTQLLFERRSMDELHPDADLSVDTLGAVDGDDIGMTDARQQSALVNDRRGSRIVIMFSPAQQT